jgi:hypothetical protein
MIEVLHDWIHANAPGSLLPQARILLQRWTLVKENYEFALNPPGRVAFFVHQLRTNRLTSEVRGAKPLAINYFNAVASLVTGYKHAGVLDTFWRKLDQAKDGLASLFKRTTARSVH